MSIPTAEDGVTLVDATLLNSYKAGIEACEPSLGIPNESGYVLTSTAEGGRAWAPPPSASPTTTAGDLVVRGAQADERLPVGSEGQALLVSGGVPSWAEVPSAVLPSTCDARLTLIQGQPVTVDDITESSNLYFTRYHGAHVALWDGSSWRYRDIPPDDIILELSGLTPGKNYDVFLYDDSSTLTLSLSSAWTNDTTRADALSYQDGVRVLASDHTKRLMGTIRATGETTTESSLLRRFVVNEFHPLPISCSVLISGDWGYASNTWRYANNDSSCKVEFLCGSVGHVEGIGLHTTRATNGEASISIDNSTGNPAGVFGCYTALDYRHSTRNSQINAELSEGYHFLGCVEVAWSGTYYCSAAGLKATIWA